MLELLELQRAAYRRDGVPSASVCKDRLTRLQTLIVDHADELATSMTADFGSRPPNCPTSATSWVRWETLEFQKKHFAGWMKPKRRGEVGSGLTSPGEIRPTPKGVVGIMGPWNFPLYLVTAPAGAAIAACNRVLLRLSEITAHTTVVLAARAPEYLSLEEFAVLTEVQGDGASFSRLKVDHMFFTGSPHAGALVAAAAGENLLADDAQGMLDLGITPAVAKATMLPPAVFPVRTAVPARLPARTGHNLVSACVEAVDKGSAAAGRRVELDPQSRVRGRGSRRLGTVGPCRGPSSSCTRSRSVDPDAPQAQPARGQTCSLGT